MSWENAASSSSRPALGNRGMLLRLVLRQARRLLVVLLLGGLLGATLVRLGPGFGLDERELDTRLSAETIYANEIINGRL